MAGICRRRALPGQCVRSRPGLRKAGGEAASAANHLPPDSVDINAAVDFAAIIHWLVVLAIFTQRR